MITDAPGLLSSHGIIPTPQRLAIFRAVYGRTDHPSVDTVFVALREQMPTLSKTTVYATMQRLAEVHLIGRVCIEDGEVRYDGSPVFHAHFKCRACGELIDFEPPKRHPHPYAAISAGFEVDDEQLLYFGLCPKCARKGAKDAQNQTNEQKTASAATRRNEK